RDQRTNLLLYRLEPDERVELGLQLVERPRLGLGPRHAELVGEIVSYGLADAFAERSKRVSRVLERVRAHVRTVPGRSGRPLVRRGPEGARPWKGGVRIFQQRIRRNPTGCTAKRRRRRRCRLRVVPGTGTEV